MDVQELTITEFVFLIIFVVLSTVVIIIVVGDRLKRYKLLNHISEQTLSETDFAKFSPQLISQLIYGKGVYTRHITAGLLNLVRKRVITLAKSEETESYYFYEKEPQKRGKLPQEEDYLIDWLLYDVGTRGRFFVDDLLNHTENKKKQEQFLERLYEWEELMRYKLIEEKLIDTFPFLKRVLTVIAVFMLLIGSGLIVSSGLLSLLFFISGAVTLIIMLTYSSMTHLGLVEYKKWVPFIQNIKRKPPSEYQDNESLTVSYVYAIAFNLSDTYVKKFPVREASQLSLKNNQFPLYIATSGPGAVAVTTEGVELINDMETSLEQIISPMTYDMVDGSDGISE
ncbi:DUF2207 domain-containing protein [Salipaludibacillus agaradhaerens]|uniref:DUF2207 domain-containing protein n=1 Tax=Salipaludibacillus agaradhaerens TaxID=76935 RepID=A0A9Q4B0N5_SALAG|nr:DUF2207 domain-containing protein [Salipaludibacillus agaradhaerens]MCR6096203.1 DUF2207 domain-containing protein [Salipaludibacillus agaradhaerens]MCR6114238.1 DUF2207 domain-containing protein [Salipaludibacillus agaradhaerens]